MSGGRQGTAPEHAEARLRRELTEVAHRTYGWGWAAATDGNVSARLDDGNFLISPSGTCLGELSPDDLVVMTPGGSLARAPESRERRPSSEWRMHVVIYEERPDVGAVLHAHPPTAIGLTVAGESLAGCVLPEVVVGLGTIPTLAYTTPTTPETAEAVRNMIPRRDALMLDRHGSVTVGATIIEAFRKLEKLEQAAKITLTAKQLGGVRTLPPEEVSRLLAMREKLGLPPTIPSCNDCGLGCL